MDTLRSAYNILKLAGSPAGFRLSDEAKAKISAANYTRGWKGENHPSYNTGKEVYLYSVSINEDGTENLTLHSVFPNLSRVYNMLNISRVKIWSNMKRDSSFISPNPAFHGKYKAYFNRINDA